MKKKLVGVIALLVALAGAASLYVWNKGHPAAASGHPHDGEAVGHGHDHGAEGLQVTHFSEQTELFMEFPRLVVAEEAAFAAHLTRLSDFKAVDQGRVTVALLESNGNPVASATVDGPTVPGIFRPILKPAQAGQYRLTLLLEGSELKATHDLGVVAVYPSLDEAAQAAARESTEEHGGIAFTKEQQWQIDFATVPVQQRDLRASVAATGLLRAHPDHEATLVAPTAGTVTVNGAFPRVGQTVTKGQVLAYLVPRLGGETDLATLDAAVRKARVAYDHAKRERERLEGLFNLEAVAEKRVHAARVEEQLAKADLDAAERRLGQQQGQGGGIALRAPVAGTLADVRVVPGAFVNEGSLVFHIAERRPLWLEVRVAESDMTKLAQPVGAWFSIDGSDAGFAVMEGKTGKLVAVGGVIDPATRTVPVIYEIAEPDQRLRIGMNVKALVYTGTTGGAIAVPAGALIDENGQPVVYVQKGGETYERRPVEVGVRDGEYVEIRRGLAAGERVVSRGAYQVRLAALSPAAVGHGHEH